jgi:rhodanese-related sulfurtransferase
MKRNSVILFLFLIFFTSLKGQDKDTVKYISLEPYDFHLTYLKADKAILIDVREVFEYNGKRIKDAVNIPSVRDLELAADTLDKESALFVYCSTDYRSKNVAERFCEKGFLKVYNLEGGIVAWKKDGFPVTRKRDRRLD